MKWEVLVKATHRNAEITVLERTAAVCDFAGLSGFGSTCGTTPGRAVAPAPEFDKVSTQEKDSACRLLQKPVPQACELARQVEILCP